MPNSEDKPSFWTTLPGIMSGVAGLLGAFAALAGALSALGVLGSSPSHDRASVTSRPAAAKTGSLAPGEITLRWQVNAFKRFTKPTVLEVRPTPAGARLIVRCEGRSCPARERTVVVREAAASTSVVQLARYRVRVGSALVVRFEHDRIGSKTWRLQARRSDLPELTASCLAPGAEIPESC